MCEIKSRFARGGLLTSQHFGNSAKVALRIHEQQEFGELREGLVPPIIPSHLSQQLLGSCGSLHGRIDWIRLDEYSLHNRYKCNGH